MYRTRRQYLYIQYFIYNLYIRLVFMYKRVSIVFTLILGQQDCSSSCRMSRVPTARPVILLVLLSSPPSSSSPSTAFSVHPSTYNIIMIITGTDERRRERSTTFLARFLARITHDVDYNDFLLPAVSSSFVGCKAAVVWQHHPY